MTAHQDSTPPECRDIPGFPGYRVWSDGRVESCRLKGPDRQDLLADVWHPLCRTRKDRRGAGERYARVSLHRDGVVHRKHVHTIVLEVFGGPCPAGMECRHLDGNPLNNRFDNLAWGTPRQNQADRIRHGTAYRGEDVITAKLTALDVIELRRLRAGGVSMRELAAKYGLSKTYVYSVVNHTSWAHVVADGKPSDADRGDKVGVW